jgi:hypothetical protein
LTGISSTANYQAAIRSITFSSTSDLFSQTSKNILVRVNDGSLNSNVLSEQITITNVNDNPVATVNLLATVAEGGTLTITNTQLRYIDPDNAASQLTYDVQLTPVDGRPVHGRIAFNTAPGTSITRFTQTDLDNGRVIYVHNGLDNTSDTFSFRVSDGVGGNSAISNFNISITPVDDQATILIPASPLTYVENSPSIAIATGVLLTDPDTPTLTQVRVQIASGYSPGNDLLLVNGTLPLGITSSWNSSTGTMTLNGPGTLSNFQLAIESLRYVNSSEFPETTTRTLTFSLTNSIGAQGTASRQLDVSSVNDSPLISVSSPSYTVAEDSAFTFSGSNKISIQDVDAQSGIIRVSLSVSNLGVGSSLSLSQTTGLTFTTGNGFENETMLFEGTLSDINAAIDGLLFDPGTDFNGSNSIQINVNDRGNSGTGGSLTANRSIAINVTAVNDPPKITGTLSAGLLSGETIPITEELIQATDVDSLNTSLTYTVVPGRAFQHGLLFNKADPTISISSFTLLELKAGDILYRHNGDSATLDSFDFIVDDGDLYSTTSTLSLLISRVNVAPDLNPASNPVAQFTENAAPIALVPNITVTDTDSPLLLGATINFLVGGSQYFDRLIFTDLVFASSNIIRGALDVSGNLTLSGVATASEYQIALRSILFENTSATPNTITRELSINVEDATLVSNSSAVQVSVTAFNTAPMINTTAGARTLEDLAFTEIGAIQVADADIESGLLRVELSSSEGLISLITTTAITFQLGDGLNNSMMVFTGTQSDINAALDSLIFAPLKDFNGVATISIVVNDAGDTSGLDVKTSNATLQITIDPINDAPVLNDASPAPIPYSEGSSPVNVFSTLSILDVDSATLTSATVQIGTGYVAAEDRLVVSNAQGLSVLWDAIAGTLSITGNADASTYEAVLRALQYENISLSVSEGARSVTVYISDAALDSLSFSKTVDVIAVNDPPLVSAGALGGFTENSASVSVFPELILSDIDSPIISSAKLKISANYIAASDLLSMANVANIVASWDPITATLTLSGESAIANYENALRQIRFSSSSDNLIDTTRSFTLDVKDSEGTLTSTSLNGFVVTPVNDAPTLSLASSISLNEDTNATILSGVAANLIVSDVDANQQNLTLIITVNRGVLTFGPNQTINSASGNNTSEITLSGTLSQLSTVISNIRFAPAVDFNGSIQLQVVIDDLQGGRDTKFAQLQVIAVNDAPVIAITSDSPTYLNTGASTAVLSNVSIKDLDSPLLESAVIRVASNFSFGDRIFVQASSQIQSNWDAVTGTLTLNGSASIQEYQNVLQSLQFSTNSSNTGARNISVSLKDANGGLASINQTLGFNASAVETTTPTVNVNPIANPPPAAGSGQITTSQTSTPDISAVVSAQSTSLVSGLTNSFAQKGVVNTNGTINNVQLDNSNSSTNDEILLGRDRRARASEANSRPSLQTANQLDSLQTKSNVVLSRETDSDLRSSLASSRNSDNRNSDTGARLLQIANRDNTGTSTTQNLSLLLNIGSLDANETVQIKVSKADQLAVDLLSLPVQSGGVVVSAAVLWWITRAGGILTALLTSLPSWQHFDPLPILTSTDGQPESDWGDENEEDDKELDAVLSQ